MTPADPETPRFAEPRAAAGVLFRNDADEILMVYPSYKDYLDIPGGYIEPGETPSQAAKREVREELSLDIEVGQLLVIDYWLSSPEVGGKEKILFVFDGGRLTPTQVEELAVDNDEIIQVAFHDTSMLDELTIPRLATRLREAAAALAAGQLRFLENGCSAGTGAARLS